MADPASLPKEPLPLELELRIDLARPAGTFFVSRRVADGYNADSAR
jgi:hypothetical protein